MVKRLLFLFVLALLTLNVMAQQITEQQAKERALRYLASNSAAKTRGLNANATTRLDATKVEAQSIYAFNIDHFFKKNVIFRPFLKPNPEREKGIRLIMAYDCPFWDGLPLYIGIAKVPFAIKK